MATIINNPPTSGESNSILSIIVGGLVVLILGALFFVYGLPALSRMRIGTPEINVAAPQIQMPDKVDVQVTQPAQ